MHWTPYRLGLTCLFTLFLLINSAHLTRVPGLMGDEGSEGENVYELLTSDHLVVVGERSYIGPLIDYLRVPFIGLFGYTTLGIRLPTLLFSLLTFLLLAFVLRRLFDEPTSLYGLTFFSFSPIYLTQQRLGWAITLLPFFTILIVYLVLARRKYAALLAGLVAGLGLSNHIMFFGTLVGVGTSLIVAGLKAPKKLLSWWPAIVGFWAGFAMQFMILLQERDDQGDVGTNATLFWQRLHDLPALIPQIVSGSSYVASYTGIELSPRLMMGITTLIFLLAILSLGLVKKHKAILLVWLGLLIQLPILLYMIDRYTLRYFAVPVLWLWLLAGLGVGFIVSLLPNFRKIDVKMYGPSLFALVLSVFFMVKVVAPFIHSGGSTAEFSLGNRTDSASALVGVGPLFSCIANQGIVFSDNIHIYNRLQYISHSNSTISFAGDAEKKQAQWIVRYRLEKDEKNSTEGELCPELKHFRVLPYNR